MLSARFSTTSQFTPVVPGQVDVWKKSAHLQKLMGCEAIDHLTELTKLGYVSQYSL